MMDPKISIFSPKTKVMIEGWNLFGQKCEISDEIRLDKNGDASKPVTYDYKKKRGINIH